MLGAALIASWSCWNARAQGPTSPRADEGLSLPGVRAAGDILLPNQWSLNPAGRQLKLGDFPVQIALHPTENIAAILHAGYGEHEVVIVDLKRFRIVSRVSVDQAFYGLCFHPQGDRLFVSGGEFASVHQFSHKNGYLADHQEFPVTVPGDLFVTSGLVCDAQGKTLYVANAFGNTLAMVSLDDPTQQRGVTFADHANPYTALPSEDGKRLFVSLWGRAAVAVVNVESLQVEAEWPTESHPTEMLLARGQDRLFVACANSNTVTVLDTQSGQAQEVIASALYPLAPHGSTPNSLALSADGRVLWIANADNNNLAMFDVSQPGKSRSLGFIPVGWYPTSVRFNPRDRQIYVANGKGLTSQANPQGPQPLKDAPSTVEQYIGGLFRGTLSAIASPGPIDMQGYTQQALACSPLRADLSPADEPDPTSPIPAQPGGPSPIKYCIYIIKENRTYDQVFGDVPEGNGDASLCIFPEQVTPNHHALAREFVLLDNFYVESEVSADGHEWSMAAYANDFVEKAWPLVYRPGGRDKLKYPSEGAYEMATPAGGYIWDRCHEANVSYRSYGEFIDNGALPTDPAKAAVSALEGHFDPKFRGYDLDYPDVKRTERFVEELKGFEQSGEMPRFIVLRLPNDHTYGLRADKPTPTAMVADNDLALGRLVEAVSQTKFWPETAIFVIEDDAQNGSDHVDAHRTVALVISPYCRRQHVDSHMYSTASMLRTMELILGLKPMSQFDAAARPMHASFQTDADLTPYAHRPAQVDLQARNASAGSGALISADLDFSREDACDDLVLNDLIWKSVRGNDARMPPPVRASFVFALPDDDDDHDEADRDDPEHHADDADEDDKPEDDEPEDDD